MTRKSADLTGHHRYALVHEDDADLVAYQFSSGDGVWRTLSTWMIPRTAC
jgi:hypothetical protein